MAKAKGTVIDDFSVWVLKANQKMASDFLHKMADTKVHRETMEGL